MSGLIGGVVSAAQKRVTFRSALKSGQLQRFPGAFSPLVAKLVEELGFDGVYVSGAVLSADPFLLQRRERGDLPPSRVAVLLCPEGDPSLRSG